MKEERIFRSLGTHDGSFHADEVTASALLLLFHKIDREKIKSTGEVVGQAVAELAQAYAAMERLRAAGRLVIPVTGRPAAVS